MKARSLLNQERRQSSRELERHLSARTEKLLPYLMIDHFKVSELLNAGFPFSAVGIFMVGFGVFFGVLLTILYVAYVKE